MLSHLTVQSLMLQFQILSYCSCTSDLAIMCYGCRPAVLWTAGNCAWLPKLLCCSELPERQTCMETAGLQYLQTKAAALPSQPLFPALLLLSAQPDSVLRVPWWNAFPHTSCACCLLTREMKLLFVLPAAAGLGTRCCPVCLE